jgi:hypothetical protein
LSLPPPQNPWALQCSGATAENSSCISESLKPDINTCYIKGKICLYMGELRSCGGATCWEELRHLQTVGGTRACWHILKNISAEIHG